MNHLLVIVQSTLHCKSCFLSFFLSSVLTLGYRQLGNSVFPIGPPPNPDDAYALHFVCRC